MHELSATLQPEQTAPLLICRDRAQVSQAMPMPPNSAAARKPRELFVLATPSMLHHMVWRVTGAPSKICKKTAKELLGKKLCHTNKYIHTYLHAYILLKKMLAKHGMTMTPEHFSKFTATTSCETIVCRDIEKDCSNWLAWNLTAPHTTAYGCH